ncbi:MAG TPA: quinone-dependent dihydroorotate dehydrogenase [Xanthomonadales bacterium]|nr:quinone-dependent dihydroorotate dehydrogenase [Xanthomonadales bacterium]
MTWYPLARKLLFATDPERAHQLTMEGLRLAHQLGASRAICPPEGKKVQCMGLSFRNAVGLAAGVDKNADYFEALGALGFGFVEVGTVTPRPQPGNPKPRIFRLPAAEAMINRLGFNNKGVDYLVQRVRNHRFNGVLGINIGKNFDTPIEHAVEDYLLCLDKVFPYADYVTVNISSPNTADLRSLQLESALGPLLARLSERRAALADEHERFVPIAVKVAPDLEPEAVKAIAEAVDEHGMDAVIATNTTVDRPGVNGMEHADEPGGLSGKPLKTRSNEILKVFRQKLPDHIALIGVGGITRGQDAADKLIAGANLVQFYTGMVYRGPELVGDCIKALSFGPVN